MHLKLYLNSGWLLLRSLETPKLRRKQVAQLAQVIADWLRAYLENNPELQYIYLRHCLSPGSSIFFEISGIEAEAFQFLNAPNLTGLASSLGNSEILAECPGNMTHSAITLCAQR